MVSCIIRSREGGGLWGFIRQVFFLYQTSYIVFGDAAYELVSGVLGFDLELLGTDTYFSILFASSSACHAVLVLKND